MFKEKVEKFITENQELVTIKDLSKVQKGDMPGDKIEIDQSHIMKAEKIFKALLPMIVNETDGNKKIVISVYGGSGVGKSEVGSLIAHYFKSIGIGAYVLSGDNYPHRIPMDNDANRLEIFKSKGKEGLVNYLGSPDEIHFEEISQIIDTFKKGASPIKLKRMGRTRDSITYEPINMDEIQVLVVEWTHGNNDHLIGIDYPVFLNSTPRETLAHRKKRNRDGNTDSPFTKMVLGIEQKLLATQAPKAALIVSKAGDFISYEEYLLLENANGPMLNAYPDSIGGSLKDIVDLLKNEAIRDSFQSFYILPSVFNTDLDRGFSIIDYELSDVYATNEDISELDDLGMDIKLDFVLNHKSVLSKEFQDIIINGRDSKYFDFFIDWNKFWDGYGSLGEEGHIIPDDIYLSKMFFRKPGLPILKVLLPDGTSVPFWNTFYQEVTYRQLEIQDVMKNLKVQYGLAEVLTSEMNQHIQEGNSPATFVTAIDKDLNDAFINYVEKNRLYLGQMDLNVESPLVWEFYDETLEKLASYGAKIVRLDAFAYTSKMPGEKNFFNEPQTWDILSKLKELADQYDLSLLPEIHTSYGEKVHEKISKEGYMTYDFFLPGLIIDAFERKTFEKLAFWIQDILDKQIKTVNMLGCHDGIPLLDLKGLLTDEQIQNLIDTVVSRGGYVKDLHGKKNIYYQVNATYFSALGEVEQRLLLARALQIFMPGKPQVWYLDLFAGKNDHEAVERGGSGAHKEINRTNISAHMAMEDLNRPIVKEQLALLKLRNEHKAFRGQPIIEVNLVSEKELLITWISQDNKATLTANLEDFTYSIETN